MTEAPKPQPGPASITSDRVGDIDAALEWYGRLFSFTLRGKNPRAAFIDMGDQFINMTLRPTAPDRPTEARHIGLVVDDRSRILELAQAAGARMVEGPFLDFLDPWGNRLEIIEYSNIQFHPKAENVMRGMGSPSPRTQKRSRNSPRKAWRRSPHKKPSPIVCVPRKAAPTRRRVRRKRGEPGVGSPGQVKLFHPRSSGANFLPIG